MLFLGRNVDEHQSLAVAPEAVLKEVGELGVPVRDVLGAVGQSVDAVAQSEERLVDVRSLPESCALVACDGSLKC